MVAGLSQIEGGSGPIAEFLSQLRRELCAHPRLAERVVAESLDHLIEAAMELQASCLPPEEAEQKAVTQFGSPRNVAKLLESMGAKGMRMQEKTRLVGIKILAAFFLAMAGAQFLAGIQFVLRSEVAGAVPVGVSVINAMLGIGLWKPHTDRVGRVELATITKPLRFLHH